MKTLALSQGTAEWHDFRKGGIGSSDAPVVIGNSPYRTKRQLFFEKAGREVIVDENADQEFIFAKGHSVEGLIRREFQDLTGVEMHPLCAVHSDFDHVRASLDGFDQRMGVLEAKLVGQAVLAKAREGEIPDHHFTQLQHQFLVTGADIGQWFGHDGKKNGVLVEIRPDLEYIKRLLELEHQFWEMVKSGAAPELSPRDYLTPEDTALLASLRDAKEQADNAAAYYESLKAQAIEKYAHDRIAGAGVRITKTIRRGSINYNGVPELSGLGAEYLEKFRGKEVVSWTVRLENGKKKESA